MDIKKKRAIMWAAFVFCVLMCIVSAAGFYFTHKSAGIPTLTIETPEKISADSKEVFTMDMNISSLGEDIYPAASFILSFDNNYLEFEGIEEGNLFITGDGEKSLPVWKVNKEKANAEGMIKIMYLDSTGGKYAFTKDLTDKNGNKVLGLKFRLKASAEAEQVYEVSFEDAVFAASDENASLTAANKNLKTVNGKIVTGEPA